MTSSVLGFSLAGWDEPNYVVQYRSPLLVACRVLILLADPLLSWPGAATGNLDGMGAALGNSSPARNYVFATGNLDGMGAALGNFSLARNYVSAIDQTMRFRWVREITSRPSTYICSRLDRVNTQHEPLVFVC